MKQEIFSEVATPSYLFDLDALKSRTEEIRAALGPKIRLCYAMKANPFLVNPMQESVDCFEVCSPGEFAICMKRKIPLSDIVLSGVSKTKADIREAVEIYGGTCTFTVESMEHFRLLCQAAKESGKQLSVLIRLTSGNQFGVDETVLDQLLENREMYPELQIRGIQYYSGTQKKNLTQIRDEVAKLDALLQDMQTRHGYTAAELEYGPGLFVPYFQSEKTQDSALEELKAALNGMWFRGRITLEMGRYLAAMCGYYVTGIVDQKVNCGQNYCILDGGIHHLNYYGQTMAMKLPYYQQIPPRTDTPAEKWNVCGSLCTVADLLVKQMPLRGPKIGDRLVFERAGAYSVTEGIYLFLSRDLPSIYFWSEKEGLTLVRKQTASYPINTY